MKDCKILLVDGDPLYRDEIRPLLEAEGFSVSEAENGAQAEKLFADGDFDLVVTDLTMEKGDSGFTLAHHVKTAKPAVKVIIVSDVNSRHGLNFSVDTEAERTWIKADAFLDKPIRFEEIKAVIDRL